MAWPNFLIIGAAKAGTSALCAYLAQHPEVFLSSTKEPNFFAYEGIKLQFRGPGDSIVNRVSVTSRAEYEALFKRARNRQAVGEASTVYLYHPAAPARIHTYAPGMKLVALLRDPVQRAYSSYMHLIRDGRETAATFEEGLAEEATRIGANWEHLWHYTRLGFYGAQLERYLTLFDQDQLLLLEYDQFRRNQQETLTAIFRFLGVNPDFAPDTSKQYNVAGLPRSRMLHGVFSRPSVAKTIAKRVLPTRMRRTLYDGVMHYNLVPHRGGVALATRRRLLEVFRDDILRLASVTGWDLAGWLDPAESGAHG